jgi:6-pyruvoyltetrahydropterin/6-carboxytetrahydropterin synthase
VYELSVRARFAAAHHLREYAGECENLHGHNYKVVARVGAEELNEEGMVADFRTVKGILQGAAEELDHGYLNETPPFDELNPTTEHIAAFLGRRLAEELPEGVFVRAVTCWESENCAATYMPDKKIVPVEGDTRHE